MRGRVRKAAAYAAAAVAAVVLAVVGLVAPASARPLSGIENLGVRPITVACSWDDGPVDVRRVKAGQHSRDVCGGPVAAYRLGPRSRLYGYAGRGGWAFIETTPGWHRSSGIPVPVARVKGWRPTNG